LCGFGSETSDGNGLSEIDMMNLIGFFIGFAGLALICIVVWMMLKQKHQEKLQRAKKLARRRAVEKATEQERQERLSKAESGDIPTILYLAKEAEKSDFREALFWYEKAAHLENATGMYGVVRLCQHMNMRRRDMILEEKSKFWKRHIEAIDGDLGALCDTGKAFLSGYGISVDTDKGTRLLERAAKANHIPAMLLLGDWYISAENPSPKPEDAFFWFKRAAKLGNDEGMMKLGINYLNGTGVNADHLKGCYWLECAGEKGNAEAMYQAGKAWMDYNSYGNAIAYIWFFLAAHCGYDEAKQKRNEIGNQMGVDSIVILQNFAKPLLKKINHGEVSRHFIIRAFNKLYKRKVPVPHKKDILNETFEAAPVEIEPDKAHSDPQHDPESPLNEETPSKPANKADFSDNWTK
jgi:TPR repeat protein